MGVDILVIIFSCRAQVKMRLARKIQYIAHYFSFGRVVSTTWPTWHSWLVWPPPLLAMYFKVRYCAQ